MSVELTAPRARRSDQLDGSAAAQEARDDAAACRQTAAAHAETHNHTLAVYAEALNVLGKGIIVTNAQQVVLHVNKPVDVQSSRFILQVWHG